MRRKFAPVKAEYSMSPVKAEYSMSWNILLYTVAFKSLFQSLETVSAEYFAKVFFYLTIFVVALGILAAVFVGRGFFAKSSRAAWNFNFADKAILVFLLFGYLGLAIVPMLVYK
jgi:hypothetical protein